MARRFHVGQRPPQYREFLRDLFIRAVVPVIGLILINLQLGWLIMFPLAGFQGETQLNWALQARRTPLLDQLALDSSTLASVLATPVPMVLATVVTWVLSRRWWVAIQPLVGYLLTLFVYAVVSFVIARPAPIGVAHLDPQHSPVGYPSARVCLALAMLAILLYVSEGIRWQWLRMALALFLGGYAVVLGWSRVYLGAQHLTDVLVSLLNAGFCALVAVTFVRLRGPIERPADTEPTRVQDAVTGLGLIRPTSAASPEHR